MVFIVILSSILLAVCTSLKPIYLQNAIDAVEAGADGALTLRALHAPLCAVGGRGLYRLDDRVPSLEHGMWYALFNNRWGTNYKTWCEDDASFTFTLSCR